MKIRVIVPFMDKQFNNEITRVANDIIDTDDPNFKCDEELARDRIAKGFCVEVKDNDPELEHVAKIGDKIIGFGPVEVKEEPKKPAKKGKKASKKR